MIDPTYRDKWEEYTIKKVSRIDQTDVSGQWSGWDISTNESIGFGIDDKDNPKKVVPHAGDKIAVCGGFGFEIRGVMINGDILFHRTIEEQDVRHKKWVVEKQKKDQEKYDKNKGDYASRWAALPPEFHARIDRFKHNNPNFGRDFEDYELFTCEQAVLVAKKLETLKRLEIFRKASWDTQHKMVPGWSSDHSGNTAGMAITIAHLYIDKPELVEKMHGALCPLVGCDQYGCYAGEKNRK